MNEPWRNVFAMSAEEFLGMLVYIREKRRREQEEINQLQNKKTY